MLTKLLIVEAIEFNPDPTLSANVRWTVIHVRQSSNQSGLMTLGHRDPDSDVPVSVMIPCEHDKHPFVHEECRFAMGQLLGRSR